MRKKKLTLLMLTLMLSVVAFAQKSITPPSQTAVRMEAQQHATPLASGALLHTQRSVEDPLATPWGVRRAAADYEIISEQPEGELKKYNRSGKYLFTQDESFYFGNQTGLAEIVFSEDGQTVYFKDPVSYLAYGTWVKGTISGNKITVPTGQNLSYSAQYDACVALGVINFNSGPSLDISEITFTIDETEGTITLDTYTSYAKTVGGYWTDDSSLQGYGDYGTVYTPFVEATDEGRVLPPASAQTKEMPYKGLLFVDGDGEDKTGTITVAIDGNDVYFQGLFKEKPEGWIKGTRDGETVVFENGQYIGATEDARPLYLLGFVNGVGQQNVSFSYDEDEDLYVSQTFVFGVFTAGSMDYESYWAVGLTIGEEKPLELVTLPDGLEPVNATYTATGWYYQTSGEVETPINTTAKIAFADNGDVYIQGIEERWTSDAWVKGTLAEGKITVPTGQCVDTDADYPLFVVGANVSEAGYATVTDIVFDYDEAQGLLTTDQRIYISGAKRQLNYYHYYDDVTLQLPVPQDVEISPADGDIAEALAAAIEPLEAGVKNITINLTEGATYTISAPIEGPASIVINGNGATIDASNLSKELISLNGSTNYVLVGQDGEGADVFDPTHFDVKDVTVKDVTVKGLTGSLIKDNQKTLLGKLTIDNSVIEMPASNKQFVDFNGKGYVGEVVVSKSTIYSQGTNNGYFVQYGSRPNNLPEGYRANYKQLFDIQNSTFVNIAKGQNFCNFNQKGTAANGYTLKNNVFVDCGKQGQVIQGINANQSSATPAWDVDGNAFNWGGADVSAAEASGKDYVKNSIAGVIVFNATDGTDFGGEFTLGEGATAPETLGDPRWTITYAEAPAELTKLYIIGINNNWDRTAMTEMTFNEETQAFEYDYAPEATAYFAFADYQQTEEEANADTAWETFNSTYRYAIGEGDLNATIGEEVQLVKVYGTIALNPGTYKISVTKDLKMTITGTETPVELEYTDVFAVGNGEEGWLNGVTWDPAAEANKMTKVEDGIFEITLKDVPAGTDRQVKFALDGTWDHNFGGTFSAFGEATDAVYNSVDNITFSTTETQDITIRLDLTGFNFATKAGAKFTITTSAATGIHMVNAGKYGEGAWYTIQGTPFRVFV